MKTAVIIGGSGGIGKEVATAFFKKGYNCAIGYFSNEKIATTLANTLNNKSKNNRATALKIDTQNEASVNDFFAQVTKIFGQIDVMVNCSGVSHPNLLIDCSSADINHEIGVNLYGTIMCAKAVAPIMISAGFGRIINISSMWGVSGSAFETTYSATKAGVIGFDRALAKELASANITVNTICPGAVKTKMNAHLTACDYAQIKKDTPLGSLISAKEIAQTALFLASSSAKNITGQTITIDGGFTL